MSEELVSLANAMLGLDEAEFTVSQLEGIILLGDLNGVGEDEEDVPNYAEIAGRAGAKSVPERLGEKWRRCMDGFGSAEIYKDRIDDFAWFCDGKKYSRFISMESRVYDYFMERHDEGRWAGSTFRSWFSVFEKFWLFVYNLELSLLRPDIPDSIGKWEKLQKPRKKALVFTIQDMVAIREIPLDDWSLLPSLAFMVVSLSFAARGIEAASLAWNDVRRDESLTGEVRYVISFVRRKRKGVPEVDQCWVIDPYDVLVLDTYMGRFHGKDTSQMRFFQHLKRDGFPKETNGQIGRNILGKVKLMMLLMLPKT
jgi:hypothetical protein